MAMEILVEDSFVEYPEDVTRQWGAVVVAQVDGRRLKGQYPPMSGMPGAETAAKALVKARQDLQNVASALGADIASVVRIHAA